LIVITVNRLTPCWDVPFSIVKKPGWSRECKGKLIQSGKRSGLRYHLSEINVSRRLPASDLICPCLLLHNFLLACSRSSALGIFLALLKARWSFLDIGKTNLNKDFEFRVPREWNNHCFDEHSRESRIPLDTLEPFLKLMRESRTG
jgi:hypothetical protein